MKLVLLIWCIIVSGGIVIYGACLWMGQKKTRLSKSKFVIGVLVACTMSFIGSIIFLTQTGRAELFSANLIAFHTGTYFLLAYAVYKFINYWQSIKLRVFLTALVLAFLSYWVGTQAQLIYWAKKSTQCPVPGKLSPAEASSYIEDISPSYPPNFWFQYFNAQKRC